MKPESELIEKALKDEIIPDLHVLCPNSIDIIVRLLDSRPDNFYLGE